MIGVVSYCRVSTDKEDQIHSFEAQKRYFREYAALHPEWEFIRIYADEGLSGTGTAQRKEFCQMMQDAHSGMFRLILTKEVSRFSRNLLDTIACTRELRKIGVGVLFLNDGIHTLDPDAELRLSITASLAQEESRRISERVKWGQSRRMEEGVVFGRSLLGYDTVNGKLYINPEGAGTVRRIFQKYGEEKKSTSCIARELKEEGLRTLSGKTDWSCSHIIKILKNEKYVGDLVQKKSFTPDFLTHEKKTNRGEEPIIVIRSHHPAIISRTLWETVQSELKRRSHAKREIPHSVSRPFSGKILCGECGTPFVSRPRRKKDGTVIHRWGCRSAAQYGHGGGNAPGCSVGRMLTEDTAIILTLSALRYCVFSTEDFIDSVIKRITEAKKHLCTLSAEQSILEETRIRKKLENLLDLYVSGEIGREAMLSLKEKYEQKLRTLPDDKANGNSSGNTAKSRAELRRALEEILLLHQPENLLIQNLLHSVTVFKDGHTELRLNRFPAIFFFCADGSMTVYPQSPRDEQIPALTLPAPTPP